MNPDEALPPEGEKVMFSILPDPFYFYAGYFEKGRFRDASGIHVFRPADIADWKVSE
jgi:hypothetical protein